MEYEEKNGFQIYSKYKRWGQNLFWQSIYSKENDLWYHTEGNYSSRPGTYISKKHGRWEITSWSLSNPSVTFIIQHKWYWYGEEITEGEWIVRTKK